MDWLLLSLQNRLFSCSAVYSQKHIIIIKFIVFHVQMKSYWKNIHTHFAYIHIYKMMIIILLSAKSKSLHYKYNSVRISASSFAFFLSCRLSHSPPFLLFHFFHFIMSITQTVFSHTFPVHITLFQNFKSSRLQTINRKEKTEELKVKKSSNYEENINNTTPFFWQIITLYSINDAYCNFHPHIGNFADIQTHWPFICHLEVFHFSSLSTSISLLDSHCTPALASLSCCQGHIILLIYVLLLLLYGNHFPIVEWLCHREFQFFSLYLWTIFSCILRAVCPFDVIIIVTMMTMVEIMKILLIVIIITVIQTDSNMLEKM